MIQQIFWNLWFCEATHNIQEKLSDQVTMAVKDITLMSIDLQFCKKMGPSCHMKWQTNLQIGCGSLDGRTAH